MKTTIVPDREQLSLDVSGGGHMWLFGAVVYLVFGGLLCWLQQEQVDTDGISYVVLAEYIAAGDFVRGVSGIWSPLLPWLTAIPIAAGVPSLLAMHLVLYLSGFAGLVGAWRVLGRMGISGRTAGLVFVGIALIFVRWSFWNSTPDFMMCCFLFLYGAETLREDAATNWRVALRAGLFGGLAFLAKRYAFPFVIVHSFCTLLLLPQNTKTGWLRRGKTWGICVTACMLVMLVFVIPLSLRAGKLTTGFTNVNIRLTLGAVLDPPQTIQYNMFLTEPTPPDISSHIDSGLVFFRAEPIRPHLHDIPAIIKHAAGNLQKIRKVVFAWDPIGLYSMLFCLTILLSLLMPSGASQKRYRWIAVSCVIAFAGFVPLLHNERYVVAFVKPLLLIAAFLIVTDLCAYLPNLVQHKWRIVVGKGILFIILIGMTVSYIVYLPVRYDFATFSRIGRELHDADLPSPMATSIYGPGLVMAYHLDKVSLGEPYVNNMSVSQALKDSNARTFLAWGGKEGEWQGLLGPDWACIKVFHDLRLPKHTSLYVFVKR